MNEKRISELRGPPGRGPGAAPQGSKCSLTYCIKLALKGQEAAGVGKWTALAEPIKATVSWPGWLK